MNVPLKRKKISSCVESIMSVRTQLGSTGALVRRDMNLKMMTRICYGKLSLCLVRVD